MWCCTRLFLHAGKCLIDTGANSAIDSAGRCAHRRTGRQVLQTEFRLRVLERLVCNIVQHIAGPFLSRLAQRLFCNVSGRAFSAIFYDINPVTHRKNFRCRFDDPAHHPAFQGLSVLNAPRAEFVYLSAGRLRPQGAQACRRPHAGDQCQRHAGRVGDHAACQVIGGLSAAVQPCSSSLQLFTALPRKRQSAQSIFAEIVFLCPLAFLPFQRIVVCAVYLRKYLERIAASFLLVNCLQCVGSVLVILFYRLHCRHQVASRVFQAALQQISYRFSRRIQPSILVVSLFRRFISAQFCAAHLTTQFFCRSAPLCCRILVGRYTMLQIPQFLSGLVAVQILLYTFVLQFLVPALRCRLYGFQLPNLLHISLMLFQLLLICCLSLLFICNFLLIRCASLQSRYFLLLPGLLR